MVILFAPSEGKKEGGTLPPMNSKNLLFPELYSKRLVVIQQYEHVIRDGDDEALYELFGIKDTKEYERYRAPLSSAATMKAIERYDGVAYDYLEYQTLASESQYYLDKNVILFSNLFGPIYAGDSIPDYKLKQGAAIGTFAPEKYYKEHFSGVLNEMIGDQEILDIRAGFYDKFYTPTKQTTTLKFLKEGKVVSHWAKAYRGVVLREAAKHQIRTIEELLALNIEGLFLNEIVETKKKKEVIYTIV
ncbi:MAG: YaaA family protein [Sulfuricurvum sp.]|uniref:YaaA family protein n=1 Tax=Sulfuricurvum sp. TaxID=2025608 RepID=UPI0026273CC2|nr:YaaA family protein [Sulfuricurvum sp.]MDD2369708.1 YaaA family protein [Sulfuricurvum sp.]MDD2950377.1 YaaA family protein [Sulfuricurvum sp.]MDD5119549.1 YaaA family protein [Sulfuricurvum sp.]